MHENKERPLILCRFIFRAGAHDVDDFNALDHQIEEFVRALPVSSAEPWRAPVLGSDDAAT